MTNIVVLTGRVTRNIDIRTGRNGNTYAPFTVAINEKYADGTQTTYFINVMSRGKLAELVAKWSGKGLRITVTGHLETYKNRDDVTVIQVVADEVDFIDFKEQNQEDKEVDDLLEEEGWVF